MTAPLPLHDWAARWQIPPQCMTELMAVMGATEPAPAPPSAPPGASEAWAQSAVRLEAPRFGVWLTRNNVGALLDKRGVPVRYGLANESPAQNEVLKSGDLIGIRAVLVQPWHVGATIGQFISREMKAPGWTYSGKGREAAQMAWAQLITKYGGDAKFCTGEGSFA